MTLEEIVDKYGSVRIDKVSQPVVVRKVVNNQFLEETETSVFYQVTARNCNPSLGATLEIALENIE